MGNGGGGSEIARYALDEEGYGRQKDASFKTRMKEGYSLATGAQAGLYIVPGLGSNKGQEQKFKAKVAADPNVDPSWIAGKLGLSEQQRQANFNANALRDAKAAQRDLHGPGDDPMIYREEKRKKEEAAAAAAAAAAKKAEEDAKATTTATNTTSTATTPTDTTTTAVNTQATDYSKLLNDMQAKYDAQLSAFQSEMDAATQKQADQLTALTEATAAHKKKLKKKRKYGRLSLLFGSELGLPETTTLGTGTG